MTFHQWIQAQPFEFWPPFVIGVASLLLGIFQLLTENRRFAAAFFFLGTTVVMFLIGWRFFAKSNQESFDPSSKEPILTRPWAVVTPYKWTNVWPNLAREPDYVSAQEHDQSDKFRILSMWVEGISLTQDQTVVHVAVRNGTDDRQASLEPGSGSYIVDDQGRSYDFISESRYGEEPFTNNGEIRPGVVERFELVFPIIQNADSMILNHPQFSPITVFKRKPKPSSLKFCRPWKLSSAWIDTDISCDGLHATDLSVNSSANVQIHFGKHSCKAKFKNWIGTEGTPINFDALQGQTYFFQVEAQGNWISRPEIKWVPTDSECTTLK